MKKISQIETGGRFLYGGVEWVKLYVGDGTVAISAEPVFERAFDEDNKNDWRSSSLRRELNGAFLDALVAEGADRAAFLDWESDLTADDGMTDYGTATDKIALLSDKLYHFYPRPPRGGRQQKQRQNLYFQINYTTFCTNLEEP